MTPHTLTRNGAETPTAKAIRQGYTVAVFIQAGVSDIDGWAKPGADYEDVFPVICQDTGDTLVICGWYCTVEETGEVAVAA
jgi:hypothetical protein